MRELWCIIFDFGANNFIRYIEKALKTEVPSADLFFCVIRNTLYNSCRKPAATQLFGMSFVTDAPIPTVIYCFFTTGTAISVTNFSGSFVIP